MISSMSSGGILGCVARQQVSRFFPVHHVQNGASLQLLRLNL